MPSESFDRLDAELRSRAEITDDWTVWTVLGVGGGFATP